MEFLAANYFGLSSGNSFWLVLLAFAGAAGGTYIFFLGFRMLRFKRMILNTPLSRIHSASIGLVEVNGTPVGPQVLTAPISGDPCYYYRVKAWQRVESDGKQKWVPVLDESLCVPFFLEDGTGRVLIDPQGAHMDVHRSFSDEVSISSLQSNLAPQRIKEFLSTRGIVPSDRIKLDERTIPQGYPLFVFGTLGENTATNGWIPSPQISGAAPLSFSFHPGGGTITLRMISRRSTMNPEKALALVNALGRVPGVHVETRVTRVGPSPMRFSTSIATALLPPPTSPAPANNPWDKSKEFDLHPSVCIGKGERNELYAISSQSQREVVGKLAWQSAACIWGGPALALLCIYFLKVYFEWLP